MDKDKFYLKIQRLLSNADIKINGDRPWDIRVHNKNLYPRILAHGSLGLGEAYMDGWWDCERLDEFICRVLKANLDAKINPWTAFFSCASSREDALFQ
jgi:cyclopropane-fatty-acyl-phospholipid synthase